MRRFEEQVLNMTVRGFLLRLLAGVAFLNLIIIGLAAWTIQQQYDLHHEQAENNTQNLVLALDSQLQGQIEAQGMALFAVQDELYRQQAEGRVNAQVLNTYIGKVRSRLPGIDAIRITDAQGLLVYGTDVKPETKTSLADRPHFIRLRDDANADLVISKPQISRVNNKVVIVLARRLARKDGAFGGMVFAAVPLAHLTRTFASLDVGEHGVVAMRDDELSMVARFPESSLNSPAIGSKTAAPELQRLVQAGQTSGTYRTDKLADHVERTISFRKVGDYPFYLVVGRASMDYLEDAHLEAKKITGLVAFFVLVTIMLAAIVYRSWQRQNKLNLSLRESEARLNELFENMSSGVAVYRASEDGQDFMFSGVNRAAERFDNARREDLLGRNVTEVFPGVVELGLLDVFRRVWKTGIAERFPLSFYHDGRISGWRDNFVYKLPSGEIVAIYDDVTERMKAQQELEQLNRDFVTLLESTSDFIYLKDRNSRIRFCSQSMAEITGHQSWRDMIGKHDLEIFPPETAKIYYEEELPVFRDGVPLLNKTDPYLDGRGNRGWVNTNKWPVFDADGKTVIGLFGISRDITDRVQAEEAVRLSEARYRATFDHAAVGIAQVSTEGRFLQINHVFCQIIGYTQEEVLSQEFNFQQITFPEDLASDMAQVQRLLDGEGDHYEMAKRYIRKDGGVVWVHLSVALLRDDAGKALYFISSVVDISQRKLAEQALQISMERLNEAQRIAKVGNWELDLLSGHLYWSDEIFRLFEIDPDKFGATYEAFLKAIHPDDREKVNIAYTRSLETRKPYEITHRLLMADGRIKWVYEHCESIYDAQGQALRSMGTVQDITDRKRAEEKLVESESFLRTIIENEPECIKIVDGKGRLTQMNPAGLAMIEADSLEQVQGNPVLNVIAPEYRTAFIQMHKRVLAGETMQMEFEVVGLKGGRRWLETHAVPMQDHGETVHLAVTRDISERKKAEEALQRSNADLERFAYSVSHDMRQPLRAVSGHLQLLQHSMKDKLEEDERVNLNFALDGARRMDSMIVSLLDYSRVGRKTESKQWMASRVSLDEALGFLAPLIGDTKAQISVSGEWPQVFASRDEMTRLFQNLVGNAIKFRDANQSAQAEIDSSVHGDTWRVSVRDHGVGIDPGQIDRLFHFFSRLQSRTRFEGTGMGLALCRRIVEHHQGRIWAESEGEGKGSTFIFELPLNIKEGESHA